MATIATPVLRHVRKTITFDGGANNGNLGDEIPLFAVTGVVNIKPEDVTLRCTETMACSSPTLTTFRICPTGEASYSLIVGQAPNAAGAAGEFWNYDDGDWDSFGFKVAGGDHFDVATNLVLRVMDEGGGADVTDGTVIVDLFYRPITDDGALTGDDASPASGMLGEAIEGAHTVEDLLRIIAAAVAGKVSGAEGNAPVFRDLNDTKDRIIAATTADGNRTAVSHDPS